MVFLLEVMNGWLSKEGHFFKTWKSRFFSLSANGLEYFSDETKTKKKGCYGLDCESSCNKIEDRKGRLNLFVLQAKGGNKSDTIILSATSLEDRDGWIVAINACITAIREAADTRLHSVLLSATSDNPRVPSSEKCI